VLSPTVRIICGSAVFWSAASCASGVVPWPQSPITVKKKSVFTPGVASVVK
jgi:hypothetical protein